MLQFDLWQLLSKERAKTLLKGSCQSPLKIHYLLFELAFLLVLFSFNNINPAAPHSNTEIGY